MTLQETNKILAVIVEIYPLFLKDRNPEFTASVWQKFFTDESYEVVETALLAFVSTDTKGFAPSIGALKEQIRQMKQTEDMTEQEAWALVSKATSNSAYNAKEEFAKLPKDIQRVVGSYEQLHEWAMMDADEVQTVIASNFQRSYRARVESQRKFDMLPSAVADTIAKLKEINPDAGKLLEGGGEA